MNITISSSSAEIIADPTRFADAIRAGDVVVSDLTYLAIKKLAAALDLAEQEDMDMVSITPDQTGVDNTVFASTKGYARHAPRIKIAIDPPNSLIASGTNVSMAIHDYSVTGEGLTPRVREQAIRFIDLNRSLLLEYWEGSLSTTQFTDRLQRPVRW